jgi:uncharacterized membrane protein
LESFHTVYIALWIFCLWVGLPYWFYLPGQFQWLFGVATVSRGIVESSSIALVLFVAAAGLLILVSGGVIYLTAAEWRDRRRQDRDKKL